MTATATHAATATDGATTGTPTGYRVGTVHHVQPKDLLLLRNIRENRLDPEFVASVKELGLLEPIVAVVDDNGDLVVRFGHRRALAAVEAGLGSVPVYVAGSDDTADPAEVDRIIRQHDENTRRTGLTAGEEVTVVEQLAAFGLSPAQIVKRKRIPRAQVDAALAISQSSVATATAARYESIDLGHVAVIAEFDDDAETVKALTEIAVQQPERFEHAAQRRRDDRARLQKVDELKAQLHAAGVKVIDDPGYEKKTAKPLARLMDKPGGKRFTAKTHASCPGHVGWVTRYNPPEVEYGCRDASRHGHYDTQGSGSSRPKAADLPDAEREKLKAARKLVIDNNKSWGSATTVRREWLKVFAKLKTPPKGAAAFISWAIERNSYKFNDVVGEELAAEWLSAPIRKDGYSQRGDIAGLAEKATEARALHIALVQCLAAFENDALDNLTWRRDGKTEWHGRYLTYLEACGYTLSDVEKYAVSSKRPD